MVWLAAMLASFCLAATSMIVAEGTVLDDEKCSVARSRIDNLTHGWSEAPLAAALALAPAWDAELRGHREDAVLLLSREAERCCVDPRACALLGAAAATLFDFMRRLQASVERPRRALRRRASTLGESPPRVLIVGAGPAGLSAALVAHRHGADVTVLERRPKHTRPVWFDLEPPSEDGGGRTAFGSQELLRSWGFFSLVSGARLVADEGGSGVQSVQCKILEAFLTLSTALVGARVLLGTAFAAICVDERGEFHARYSNATAGGTAGGRALGGRAPNATPATGLAGLPSVGVPPCGEPRGARADGVHRVVSLTNGDVRQGEASHVEGEHVESEQLANNRDIRREGGGRELWNGAPAERLPFDVLVGADGQGSHVRRELGLTSIPQAELLTAGGRIHHVMPEAPSQVTLVMALALDADGACPLPRRDPQSGLEERAYQVCTWTCTCTCTEWPGGESLPDLVGVGVGVRVRVRVRVGLEERAYQLSFDEPGLSTAFKLISSHLILSYHI